MLGLWYKYVIVGEKTTETDQSTWDHKLALELFVFRNRKQELQEHARS